MSNVMSVIDLGQHQSTQNADANEYRIFIAQYILKSTVSVYFKTRTKRVAD